MNIVAVDESNLSVYLNLCQSYEGEFSRLTKKLPDQHGLFALDTVLGAEVQGHLVYVDDAPVGFAAVATRGVGRYEVCEFYVVPSVREQGIGRRFAQQLWARLPGEWVVKQILGADAAARFWRKAISEFTQGQFGETASVDAYWGAVTCQSFSSPLAASRVLESI